MITRALQLTLLLLLSVSAQAKLIADDEDDVPMHKAMPPMMDPIPTLPTITHRVFFDISINDKPSGQIVFGLFANVAPLAVKNFITLAECKPGMLGALSNKPMCYKNTIFHRIVPDFLIQGGDFVNNDGTGGESIYGVTSSTKDPHFRDEIDPSLHLNRRYMLAMSNRGRPNSNGSQFFINTVKTSWLDGKFVVFGQVLEGTSIVKDIESHGTYSGKPRAKVEITNCGTAPLKPEDALVHH